MVLEGILERAPTAQGGRRYCHAVLPGAAGSGTKLQRKFLIAVTRIFTSHAALAPPGSVNWKVAPRSELAVAKTPSMRLDGMRPVPLHRTQGSA